MKKYTVLLPLCAVFMSYSYGQSYSVVERGPHHRTLQNVREINLPDGRTRHETNSVIEMAGGMHRATEAGWVATSPTIEIFQDGAVVRNLQFGAIFAPNLATPGAIDVSLPDGTRLTGHLLGLAYTEGNRSVMVAEVKDCAGVIGGPEQNELTFADAFTDFDVSVKFVIQRDRISQNVILHQQLPHPGEWNMTEDAVLEVLTEFTAFPAVHEETRGTVSGMAVEHVSFGSMEFVMGQAFALGNEANSVAILKSWDVFEGNRSFLVEKVPWRVIAPELANLPPVAKNWKKKSEAAVMANNLRRAPPRKEARAALKPVQSAALRPGKSGYVLDCVLSTRS